jgi:NAD(P)-dependent dehydrogenase (short-subunit alcohol dehydrogenase family)
MTRTLLPAIEQRVDREPRPEQQWLGGLAAGRLGTPEDVKGMAIFLAADASSWVPAG